MQAQAVAAATASAPATGSLPAQARHEGAVLRGLMPYLRPHLRRISLAFALIVLTKLTNLLVPIFLKEIVDGLNIPREKLTANLALTVPIALLLAYGASRVAVSLFTELRQIVSNRLLCGVTREVTLKIFRHLHRLSLRFHLSRRTGGVARDIERGSTAINELLDWTIYTILPLGLEALFVTLVLAIAYEWSFALITLATLAVYVAWTFRITEWRTHFHRQANEANTRSNECAVDSLLNYETVKYFGNEEWEARRYDEHLRRFEASQVKSGFGLSLLNFGQITTVSIGVTAMMWLAAQGVVDGRMSIGDLVLVNAYLLQLSAPLFMLGMVYRQVKQALADLRRLFDLFAVPEEVRDATAAPPLRLQDHTPPTIIFEQANFSYDRQRPILHDIHFTIPSGATVAVVGPSGSGKSTLARLLYRFYDLTSGTIRIDGHDIREVTQQSLRSHIAIVPQDTVLFNDTIYYNIAYGRPEASREEIERAAQSAHIHDFIMRLPECYATQVGERGLKLSGGEKQRVAIARALLKNPAILVFDEATSALDSHSEKAIQAELERIARGRTTLVIAHRLSTIMDADEILVLKEGRIIERGRHAALLAAAGAYAQMWRLQQQEQERGSGAPSTIAAPQTEPMGG